MQLSTNIQEAKERQQELKNQLKRYCPGLISEQGFIATWFGHQVGKMEEAEFKDALRVSVAEICMLTGLQTYDPESQRDMYVAQMRIIAKFIQTGFGYLTAAEITNAFHLNLQGKYDEVFKQYGIRQINCEFIGQVLSCYRDFKQSFINVNPDMIKIIQTDLPGGTLDKSTDAADTLNDERSWIEQQYQYFVRDPEWNCRLLPDFFYNRLLMDELIPNNFFKKFIRRSQVHLLRSKILQKMTPTSKQWLKVKQEDGSINNVLQKNYDLNKQLDSEAHQIRNGYSSEVHRYAKQLAIAGYFKYCLKRQLNHIYVKGPNT